MCMISKHPVKQNNKEFENKWTQILGKCKQKWRRHISFHISEKQKFRVQNIKWIKRHYVHPVCSVDRLLFLHGLWHFPVIRQSHCQVLKIRYELKQKLHFYNSKLKEKNRLYENATKALDKTLAAFPNKISK